MNSCCSSFACTANDQFSPARAAADLARYRKRGPDPTTRLLLEGIRAARRSFQSLLDVGSGIGVLAHELVPSTAATAVLVEASDASLKVAQEEAARRGGSGRLTFLQGDFVDLAPTLPPADSVSMDRVVCCYPAFDPLLDAALARARHLFAYSYPRDRWFVRLAIAVENLVRRLRHSPFRTFVHPPRTMQAAIERHGFRLSARRTTLAWSVEIWERQ